MTDKTDTGEKPEAVLQMSDEDFAKLNPPDEQPIVETAGAETGTDTDGDGEAKTGDTDTDTDTGDKENGAETNTDVDANADVDADADDKTGKTDEVGDKDKNKAPEKDAETGEKKPDEKSETVEAEAKTVDYEAVYKQIMAPFKANGKTIELKDPSEVIALMQMGANYTRKLQDLQPHRKVLLMLEKNELLDEGKLSFLIDLDRKNPEAIKKLIRDSGIDPLDINVDEIPTYLPGNHQVGDEEIGFRTVMEELTSSPSGKETVAEIHGSWDNTSKESLWKQPEIMSAIHEQRESGVYDLIKAEVDRRITLGRIPANTPFLEAYTMVGDEMVAEVTKSDPGNQGDIGPAPAGEKTPQVVATRAATPKSPVKSDDKAKAASPTRASPTAAKVLVNPLAQSDEEFLKQMEGRI